MRIAPPAFRAPARLSPALALGKAGRRNSEAAQFAKLFPLCALARSPDALPFPRDRRVVSAWRRLVNSRSPIRTHRALMRRSPPDSA